MSAATPTKVLRCAIYTRKSTDEGLDQNFTSIDAQFETGMAYITSQKHEGWQWCGERYDDPDYSGGSLKRPSLKRLLADVEAGKVDVIIVYKIDRWVRSLRDFFFLADVLERHGVAFVSVTQQFNTATAMGRLVMIILLAFAQFEREQGVERTRDKIAASKKRGMWMGGVPPLGYDAVDRKLVINPEEAERVRFIFRRFAEVGAGGIVKELQQYGIRTKSWASRNGKRFAGKVMDKSGLYKLLHNRIYIGQISHKDKWYPGEHAPILTMDEWNAVHDQIGTPRRKAREEGTTPFLLKGMVFGEDGRALTPTFTYKGKSRTYRYYLPTRENKEHAGASGLPRLPAVELEAFVVEQMRLALRQQEVLERIIEHAARAEPGLDQPAAAVAMLQMDQIWPHLYPGEQIRLTQLLIERVIVGMEQIEIRFRPDGIQRVTNELAVDEAAA